jgi:hypothetical protein
MTFIRCQALCGLVIILDEGNVMENLMDYFVKTIYAVLATCVIFAMLIVFAGVNPVSAAEIASMQSSQSVPKTVNTPA